MVRDQDTDFFLNILLNRHIYKFTPKTGFSSLTGFAKSRTLTQLLAELNQTFLIHSLADPYIKSFLYGQEHKPVLNWIPKNQKNIVSPLEYQYCKQREEDIAKIFENLLLFWGLLSDWLTKTNEKITKFKDLYYEFMQPVALFRDQLKTESYITKINTLFKEKYFGLLPTLIKLQTQLELLLPKLTKEYKYSEINVDTSSDDKFTELKTLENKLEMEAFIKEVRKFLQDTSNVVEKIETIVSKGSNKDLVNKTSVFETAGDNATVYYKKINFFIAQIKKDPHALEWTYLEKTRKLALELKNTFYQENFNKIASDFLHQANEKLTYVRAQLRGVNSQLFADNKLGQVQKTEKKIENQSISPLKLINPSQLSEYGKIFSMYEQDLQFLDTLLKEVDKLMPILESMANMTGLVKELELLDNLTHRVNEKEIEINGKKTHFAEFNRSFSHLSTIMKFFLYFKNFENIRKKFESEEKIELKEDESLKGLDKLTRDQILAKKSSRLALQNKAVKLAKEYISKDSQNLCSFLIEQKICDASTLTKDEPPGFSFIENFSQTLRVMELSLNYFVSQFKTVNEAFGLGKKITYINQILTSKKKNYEDADFLILYMYPTLKSEENMWNFKRSESKNLFRSVPNPFIGQTFTYDDIRNKYSIETLLNMMKLAKNEGYYNAATHLSIYFIKAEREFGLELAKLIKKTEADMQTAESKGKPFEDNTLVLPLKEIIKKCGKYHAILDYYKEFLEVYEKNYCKKSYNIFLVTVAENERDLFNVGKQSTNNQAPALMRQLNKLYLYGNFKGDEWKITKLDQLPGAINFPKIKSEDRWESIYTRGDSLKTDIFEEINSKNAHVHSPDLINLLKILKDKSEQLNKFNDKLQVSKSLDFKLYHTEWSADYNFEKTNIAQEIDSELKAIKSISGIAEDVVNASLLTGQPQNSVSEIKADTTGKEIRSRADSSSILLTQTVSSRSSSASVSVLSTSTSFSSPLSTPINTISSQDSLVKQTILPSVADAKLTLPDVVPLASTNISQQIMQENSQLITQSITITADVEERPLTPPPPPPPPSFETSATQVFQIPTPPEAPSLSALVNSPTPQSSPAKGGDTGQPAFLASIRSFNGGLRKTTTVDKSSLEYQFSPTNTPSKKPNKDLKGSSKSGPVDKILDRRAAMTGGDSDNENENEKENEKKDDYWSSSDEEETDSGRKKKFLSQAMTGGLTILGSSSSSSNGSSSTILSSSSTSTSTSSSGSSIIGNNNSVPNFSFSSNSGPVSSSHSNSSSSSSSGSSSSSSSSSNMSVSSSSS